MKTQGNFDVNICLESARSEFKRLYRYARKCRKNSALTKEQVLELDNLYMDMWPDIEDRIRQMALGYATKHKALQITKLSAEVFIKEAMAKAGLEKCEIICQCYRAKIQVYSPDTRYRLMFIVKYKDIQAGKLDEFIAEFLRFNETLSALPFEVKVCK